MKKILFLHGFFATGSCPMAKALKEAFEEAAVVLTPDLPLHPKKAQNEIRTPWLTSPLYSWSITFPGGHTPTEQEIKTWYAPLAQKMLMEFSVNF